MSINRATISGNLTRDPELRRSQSGLAILRISVAVNDRRQNQQTGEWENVPNYIDCVSFGNRAEGLSNILTKGMKVAIEGKLRWSQWETNDGQKRSKVEIVIDNVEFMSSRNDQGYQAQSNASGTGSSEIDTASSAGQPAAPTIDASSSVYDEDIPF